jgi:hypothetical protein
MAQSGLGKIELIEDFTGIPFLLSETVDVHNLGSGFFAGGEGYEDSDAGIATLAGPNGIVRITGANTDADTTFIGTNVCFDVGLMGTIVLETKIRMPDLDTKEIFFGLTSILTLDEQLEDIVINASGTAVTCVADLVGFYFSDELTASATRWHGIHAGGTAADGATAADVVLTPSTDIIVADTWQVLRLEVDTNGTARWFIDGDLRQTVVGACSTTTDLAVCLAAAANTTELAVIDSDYIKVRANRDWTV